MLGNEVHPTLLSALSALDGYYIDEWLHAKDRREEKTALLRHSCSSRLFVLSNRDTTLLRLAEHLPNLLGISVRLERRRRRESIGDLDQSAVFQLQIDFLN